MIIEQHQLYQKWSKDLDFYTEELGVFQKELNLLVEKHPNLFSIIEHVEEYQRIFDKKEKKIQMLRTQIKANDSIKAEEGSDDIWDFNRIEKKQKKFVKKVESLKKNFRRFVATNMH